MECSNTRATVNIVDSMPTIRVDIAFYIGTIFCLYMGSMSSWPIRNLQHSSRTSSKTKPSPRVPVLQSNGDVIAFNDWVDKHFQHRVYPQTASRARDCCWVLCCNARGACHLPVQCLKGGHWTSYFHHPHGANQHFRE